MKTSSKQDNLELLYTYLESVMHKNARIMLEEVKKTNRIVSYEEKSKNMFSIDVKEDAYLHINLITSTITINTDLDIGAYVILRGYEDMGPCRIIKIGTRSPFIGHFQVEYILRWFGSDSVVKIVHMQELKK